MGKHKNKKKKKNISKSDIYTTEEIEELKRLKDSVKGRLSDKRYKHVRGVAHTARKLALLYGVDPYLAETAGWLHDWDKKLTPEELWEQMDYYHLGYADHDMRMVPLLHGWTAAAALPVLYPELPPEVFQAIDRHTTGAPDMSDLDMVVYVADMIEPTREGDYLRELRESVGYASLEELFAESVRLSTEYCFDECRYIFPGAIEVWNAYYPCLAK